jgi:hypothetical protein
MYSHLQHRKRYSRQSARSMLPCRCVELLLVCPVSTLLFTAANNHQTSTYVHLQHNIHTLTSHHALQCQLVSICTLPAQSVTPHLEWYTLVLSHTPAQRPTGTCNLSWLCCGPGPRLSHSPCCPLQCSWPLGGCTFPCGRLWRRTRSEPCSRWCRCSPCRACCNLLSLCLWHTRALDPCGCTWGYSRCWWC